MGSSRYPGRNVIALHHLGTIAFRRRFDGRERCQRQLIQILHAANFAPAEGEHFLLFSHIRSFCIDTCLSMAKNTNMRLLCFLSYVGDCGADLCARERTVRREHLSLQVDRQGKAGPVTKRQSKCFCRWPQIADDKRLGS